MDSNVLHELAKNGNPDARDNVRTRAEAVHAGARSSLGSLLFEQAEAGNIAQVREILDAGADPQAKMKDGRTALMAAAGSGHIDVVKLLLDAGADPFAKITEGMNKGETAFMCAAWNGNADVVKLLLDAGADPLAKITGGLNDGETALMYAAWNGHADVVRLLLDAGADIFAKNQSGWTALMNAAKNGHADVVRLLLDAGSDPLDKDEVGGTVLMYAAGSGHADVVELLLDAGADPLAQNRNGKTAFDLAEEKNMRSVTVLLRAAADAAANAPSTQKRNGKGGQRKAGVASAAPPNTGERPAGDLRDRVFLFTGKFSVLSRKQAKKLVYAAGGRSVGELSGKVTDLVAGEKAGNKLDQAKARGVAVMNEADFIKLMRELGHYQG